MNSVTHGNDRIFSAKKLAALKAFEEEKDDLMAKLKTMEEEKIELNQTHEDEIQNVECKSAVYRDR